jgi:NDP-sugar pyrophosphorylase family protein
MKAYLLSAGLGTRLLPLTKKTPKVMLPIGGKPLLWYQLQFLKFYGIYDVIINLHQNPEIVTNYFGDGKSIGMNITYALEKKLLGTAGSVKKSQNYFANEPFLVIYADTIRTIDINKLIKFHEVKKRAATIALYETNEPWTQGIVKVDKNDRIISLVEKPKNHKGDRLSNAGIIIFEPLIFDYIPKNKFSDFGFDVLPKFIEFEQVYAYQTDCYIQDIGTPERYARAKNDFAKNKINFPFSIVE